VLGVLAGRAFVRSVSCEYLCMSDSMRLPWGGQQYYSLLAILSQKAIKDKMLMPLESHTCETRCH